MYLGSKIGTIDTAYWGGRSEEEFLDCFKGFYPFDKLKEGYKKLPKPKKVKKKDGLILDSGESK